MTSVTSHANCSRNFFYHFNIPMVVSALKQWSLLCCAVHGLFQEVSRLLAVFYTLSPSIEGYSIRLLVHESRSASFFHQASLGAHVRPQLKQKFNDLFSSSSTSLRMLSRLNLECESIVILLPVDTLAGSSEDVKSLRSFI